MKALKVTGIIVGTIISTLVISCCLIILVNPHEVNAAGIPDGFAEKQFDTGEVVLNYVEGPDNGPPLLLIPGQMESWQGYKPVLPSLSEKFHVFAVDVRGNGKSTWTTGHYSYNEFGNDLRIFLDDVHYGKLNIGLDNSFITAKGKIYRTIRTSISDGTGIIMESVPLTIMNRKSKT